MLIELERASGYRIIFLNLIRRLGELSICLVLRIRLFPRGKSNALGIKWLASDCKKCTRWENDKVYGVRIDVFLISGWIREFNQRLAHIVAP